MDADTPTPRTNAVQDDINFNAPGRWPDQRLLDFARTLERDLAACQRERYDLMSACTKENTRAEQAEAALEQIRTWPDEDNEWDAVEKYNKVRELAERALRGAQPASAPAPAESDDRKLLREILNGMPAPDRVARIREVLAQPEPLFCMDPIACLQGKSCERNSK